MVFWRVRIESGWSNRYTRNGKALSSGVVVHSNGETENVVGRSVVEFVPCKWNDLRVAGLSSETTP
jgi:hypothetical protein